MLAKIEKEKVLMQRKIREKSIMLKTEKQKAEEKMNAQKIELLRLQDMLRAKSTSKSVEKVKLEE